MKMNKLAAGALALALGLGAVAPAVAAETKANNSVTSFAQQRLSILEKELNEMAKLIADKETEYAKLKELTKEAPKSVSKTLEDAMKKHEELKSAVDENTDALKTLDGEDSVEGSIKYYEKAEGQAKTAFENAPKTTDAEKKAKAKLEVAYIEAKNKTLEAKDAKKAAESVKDKLQKDLDDYEKSEEYRKALNSVANYKQELAAYNRNVAKAEELRVELYETEKDEDIIRKYNLGPAYATGQAGKYFNEGLYKEFNRKVAAAASFGVDAWKIAEAQAKIKENPAPKVNVKPDAKKDNLAELKRAREEALTAIKAVKLLKELSPEKIKNVEAKLNALVAKNEELVKKADAKIAAAEKKMAFIATAYAAEEADDTDALIKELDSTTSEIKELIKDKPEEKKPEEKTPSKKAGNNAKTGVAGVAGIAGILAAASVAYAASKRD